MTMGEKKNSKWEERGKGNTEYIWSKMSETSPNDICVEKEKRKERMKRTS